MENPLTSVYFEERCNACGSSYPINLYEIYREQRLDAEWHSARPCETCSRQRERLVESIPAQELTDLVQAWEKLATALEARGLSFTVGSPPVAGR